MQLILVSGLAGAGKSTALRILEDSGYTCIDNLPPPLLPQLLEIYKVSSGTQKIAVGVDTRSYAMILQLPDLIRGIKVKGISPRVIFLDAKLDVLITRYSETRRKHPLSDGKKTISDCIYEERNILAPISSMSHHIDTSDLTANQLRSIIKQFVNADYSQLNIVVQSFGFKYGLPIDSDFVFDVRCLPNPYYDKNIRDFNGTEEPIIKFLKNQEKVQIMINDIYLMILKWLPEFSQDNRSYLTIAIGCTGGMHRSVYIAEVLGKLLLKDEYKTIIRHRQL